MRHWALWSVLLSASCGQASDPCQGIVEGPIQALLRDDFPGYRTVGLDDYSEATIDRVSQYAGVSQCIPAARGDFNGDRRPDVVFLAVSPDQNVEAFAALNGTESWSVAKLFDLRSSVGCCYVDSLPPGSYENVYGTDPDPSRPLRPNERLEATSTVDVPVIGALESTGIAWFLEGGQWYYVWIAD